MYNLTPKMTRFKLHKKSAAKTALAQRFRTNLLRTEIKFHQRRIAQLGQQADTLESQLCSSLTWLFRIRVKAFIKKVVENYILSCQNTHRRKLANLGLNISQDKNESAIFNDTNIRFTDDENELLSLGLKHAFFPKSIDFKNVQAAFEDLFTQAAPFVENRNKLLKLKNCLVNCYSDFIGNYFHSKRTNYYFSDKTHTVIASIQDKIKEHNLVIVKADKGQTVVIMHKSTYIIGHNYHGHYLHAGSLSVNNYVRENKVREVNVRE